MTSFDSASRQEQGFRNTDKGPVLGHGCLQAGSLVLFLAAMVVAWHAWRVADPSLDPQIRRVMLIGAGIAGIPFLVTIVQVIRLFRSLGRAELFTVYESLPLGYHGNVTYVRPLRHGAAVRELEARLQCDEVVMTGRGKNKSTKRQTVIDLPLSPITTPALDQLRVQIPLQIPATGPASLDLSNAKIKWFVRLRLKMQGCPNTRSSFELSVAPAVVTR